MEEQKEEDVSTNINMFERSLDTGGKSKKFWQIYCLENHLHSPMIRQTK